MSALFGIVVGFTLTMFTIETVTFPIVNLQEEYQEIILKGKLRGFYIGNTLYIKFDNKKNQHCFSDKTHKTCDGKCD